MQENYLAKWLNNELTEGELAEFKNSEEYATYQRIIETSGRMESPDFNTEEAMSAIQNKRTLDSSKVVQLNPFRKFMKVAAVAAILIIGGYFYMNTLNKTVSTEFAERTEIQLPDNSAVILNAGSTITFSERNWKNERRVTLEGEAFFKVAKGEKFTVQTAAGEVTVLGTQFNVEDREDFFEVSCYEGLVSVTHNGTETKLPAGTSYVSVSGKIVETTAQLNGVPSWVNNESSFMSIPLKYVFDELGRQHNITVEIKDIDTNQLYTGSFSNSNLDLALKSISIPSRIKFKFEGRKVLFYAEKTP